MKEFNTFIKNLRFEDLSFYDILHSCMNIIIYMRNVDLFKNRRTINGMKKIFYILINQFDMIKNMEEENEPNKLISNEKQKCLFNV